MLPSKMEGKPDTCIDDPVLNKLDCASSKIGGRRTAVEYGSDMELRCAKLTNLLNCPAWSLQRGNNCVSRCFRNFNDNGDLTEWANKNE